MALARSALLCWLAAGEVLAQQRPHLGKGWNLGNTLEGPGNPRAEWIFQTVRAKGFDWVRIPVKWDDHTTQRAPYQVDMQWLGTVQETVDWAIKHGLTVLINAHHEDWLDNAGANFAGKLARFVAIWTQVANHFKGYADTKLVFEICNEPKNMGVTNLNMMNAAVLPAIRKTNPTRQVHFGGLSMMNRAWIISNPNAMHIPNDGHIAVTVHSYDPWAFAGDHPSSTTFSDAEVSNSDRIYGQLASWAKQKGVVNICLNEFGVTNMQSNKADRLKYYRTNTQAAVKHGLSYAIWDDNGWWQTLNRGTRQWQQDVLDQLANPTLTNKSSIVV